MEFERKIAGYLSKSFQQGCEKNFYKSKRTFWGRWFNVNFKCLYLFLYFEQDGFRRPAKNFWTNVATAISFSRGTFWERILVQRTLDPFCGDWAKFSGRLMWTFWQGFSNCILCVQGNTLKRNVTFEKVSASAHVFLDSEPKICGPSSKKCRKFCQKCFRCMDNNNDSRINFWSIILLYLYWDFEQKVFDFPWKDFVRVVATAVDSSSGKFGGINWFLKIRVFFKSFMKFEPKACGNLSQIFNERLCELISKCVEEILEHFFRKKNNFSYIL